MDLWTLAMVSLTLGSWNLWRRDFERLVALRCGSNANWSHPESTPGGSEV